MQDNGAIFEVRSYQRFVQWSMVALCPRGNKIIILIIVYIIIINYKATWKPTSDSEVPFNGVLIGVNWKNVIHNSVIF